MYSTLLIVHSIFRWLVLLSLVYAIVNALRSYYLQLNFRKSDDLLRHWTATIAHVQFMIGMVLYFKSPVVKFATDVTNPDFLINSHQFFRYVHISLMLLSVVLITIGSAKSKRAETDALKFKIMLLWFSIALLIIFLAIPWPFSPLVSRPYLRIL